MAALMQDIQTSSWMKRSVTFDEVLSLLSTEAYGHRLCGGHPNKACGSHACFGRGTATSSSRVSTPNHHPPRFSRLLLVVGNTELALVAQVSRLRYTVRSPVSAPTENQHNRPQPNVFPTHFRSIPPQPPQKRRGDRTLDNSDRPRLLSSCQETRHPAGRIRHGLHRRVRLRVELRVLLVAPLINPDLPRNPS